MMMIDVWLAILQVCYWKHRKIMGFIQLQVGKAKIYVYFLGFFLHQNTMQVWYPNSNCYLKLCSIFLTILNCVFQQRLDQGDSASVVCTLLLRVSRRYNNSICSHPILHDGVCDVFWLFWKNGCCDWQLCSIINHIQQGFTFY